MRLSPALLLAVALAACGDVGTAERLSAKETLDGVDVPTIGTVGDFPEPEHRHVVNVTADGKVVVEDETFATYWQLLDELTRRGDRTPGDEIPNTHPPLRLSDAKVVLRVDGAAPWGVAQWALGACAEARIPRVSFAVRHEVDRSDGVLGFPIPYLEGGSFTLDIPGVVVDVGPRNQGESLPALYDELSASQSPRTRERRTILRVDPCTPTRFALATIDAAIRGGATCVRLTNMPMPRRNDVAGFLDAASRWRGGGSACWLRIKDKSPHAEISSAAMPAVKRVHGEIVVPGFDFRELYEDEWYATPRSAPSAK